LFVKLILLRVAVFNLVGVVCSR